ncbi:cysteine-rich receptor-like protein kinase 2 isoform X2 [Neltuma alba]|uniref:cysteine-rich receptor-like protein kinase 2 isoform X2 n=1 Tax=Neltuma alba TaxID=207710 RepID=UPI0010A57E2B|nr:cysteine-rich receptor-like protein kinase 2 isoform X2 [Prosopis alba]
MLQPDNLLSLVITFAIWSWGTLNGVVSEPQTNLVARGCTPAKLLVLSNFSIINHGINATFRDIRDQIVTQNKYFATAQQANSESSVSSLFQCRNYLSVRDCLACFDVATVQIRNGSAAGGYVVYDGCFLRYETNAFFWKTTEDFNAVSCGNQTVGESITLFTSLVQQLLKNLQTTTPKKQGFFAATKIELPDNNGTTVYGFAQCIETVTPNGCFNCLNTGYDNIMPTCLPKSDGRAYADGCFMRYSTSSFFPHYYQPIDITSLGKQEEHLICKNYDLFENELSSLVL